MEKLITHKNPVIVKFTLTLLTVGPLYTNTKELTFYLIETI